MRLVLWLAISSLFLTTFAARPKTGVHSIQVKLFEQPCSLEGPFETGVLKTIHEISPEEIENYGETPGGAALKRSLDRVKKATGVPPELDRYRDKLTHRIEGLLAFTDAVDAARKAKSGRPLADAAKKYFNAPQEPKLVDFTKKALGLSFAGEGPSHTTLDMLYDLYGQSIEPDPQEEFHRGIEKAKVRYVCAFE